MGVDSQILGNYAKSHRIEHDGSVFEFRLIDQQAKAEWERRLYERAVRAAGVLAERKGKEWYEGRLVELEEAFFEGDFSFLSELSQKLVQKPAGMELLLAIITGRELMELLPLLTTKRSEVRAKIHLVMRESFPGVKFAVQKEGEGE